MKTLPTSIVMGVALLWATSTGVPGSLTCRGTSYLYSTIELPDTEATYEFWFRTSHPDGGLFEARQIGTASYDRNIHLRGGNIVARLWSEETIVTTGLNLADGQWHHVAHVFGASVGGQQLYIDGLLRASGVKVASDFTTQNDVVIGYSRLALQPHLQGEMDEVRIWSRTWTKSEIQAGMSRRLDGDEAGLVACWHLDESVGLIATDASGNGHTAKLMSSPVWNPAAEATAASAVTFQAADQVTTGSAVVKAMVNGNGTPATSGFLWGTASTAVELDGVVDYLHAANGPDLSNKSFTIEFWAQRQRFGVQEVILGQGGAAAHQGLHIGFRSDNGVFIDFYGNALNSGLPITDTFWHHWAFTYDATNRARRIYQDGRLVAQHTATANYQGSGPVLVGAFFGGNFFKGRLDDLRIWSASLEGLTLKDWMSTDIAASHPNHDDLVGYWPMDEGAGIHVSDLSDQASHAVFCGQAGSWVSGARPVLSEKTPSQSVEGPQAALSLDGVDDYVVVPEGEWFSGEFTIEARVFVRRIGSWARVIDFGNGANLDNVLLALSEGTTGFPLFSLRLGSSEICKMSARTPLPLNQWTHLAVTSRFVSSGFGIPTYQVTLFVEGAAVAHQLIPFSAQGVSRSSCFIGRSNWSQDAYADAVMDNVRIWDVAVDPETLREWMDRAVASSHPQVSALLAEWRFDEEEGIEALDSGPAGQHGTHANGASRLPNVPVGAPLSDLDAGQTYHFQGMAENADGLALGSQGDLTTLSAGSGTALRFDGLDDVVRINDLDNALPTREVTVEFWQRVHAAKPQSTFSLEPDVISNRMQAHVPWDNGTVYWDFGNTSGGGRLAYTPPVPIIGTWQHFAFVSSKDGNFMRIYRNGVLEAHKDGASVRTSGEFDLRLGCSNVFFDGELDEFRLWNVARTETEIQRDYNLRLSGTETDLVAYHRMDEGTGWVLRDSGPNHFDGLLTGGTHWTASTAPVGAPVPTVLPASEVGYGRATLNGKVKQDGLPTAAYFEVYPTLGELSEPNPNSIAEFFNVGYGISALSAVNFTATPALTTYFETIDYPRSNLPFWLGGPGDRFAARFTGRLFLPETGLYTFYANSDDGSQVFIDGRLIVNNDGLHGMAERSGNVFLEAGARDFEVRMFENDGDSGLQASYAGPNIPKQLIPAEAFRVPDFARGVTVPVDALLSGVGSEPVSASVSVGAGSHVYRLIDTNGETTQSSPFMRFTMPHPAAGSALQLDGWNDATRVTPVHGFPSTAMTVEFWMRTTDTLRAGTPISYAAASHDNEFLFYDYRDFKIIIGNDAGVDTDVSANDGEWHHLAVRWNSDGGLLDVFKDGARAYSIAAHRAGYSLIPNGSFVLGQEQDSLGGGFEWIQAFQGQLDEVRVWNSFRSESEIVGNQFRQLRGDEAGLVLYFRADGQEGDTQLEDASAIGNHADLLGGAGFVTSGARMFQPIVHTQLPTPVLATTATLRGTINPAGADTIAYFEYGFTTAYGNRTPTMSVGSGITPVPFAAALEALQPGTTYQCRLVAYNQAGTNYGVNQSFTTLVLAFGWPISTKLTGGQATAPHHVLDEVGNTYVSGLFSGAASFASSLAPAGGYGTNAFVGVLARGADWLWATNIPCSGPTTIHAIQLTPDGNLCVAGEFSGQPTFGSYTLPNATNDLFVAQLDLQKREWLWAASLSQPGPHAIRAMTVGNTNIVVAGYYSGSIDVPTDPPTHLDGMGGRDVFVAALDFDGNWLWARAAGGSALDESATALVVDSHDNVYVAGYFGDTGVSASFGSTELFSAGAGDLFVAQPKLTPEGEMEWELARRAGGVGDDFATGLAIDSADQLYLLGRFAGAANYNGVLNLNAGGQESIFVAKLSSLANVLWYRQGGPGFPTSVAVDSSGQVYATGDFDVTTTFGETSLFSSGNTDVFVTQLDADSGEWRWAHKLGGSGAEFGGSIAVDPEGGVVVSGSYRNTVQIGYVLLTSQNPSDIFVARLDATQMYEHNTYVIGEPIPVPADAQKPGADGGAYGLPTITILEKVHQDTDAQNAFTWSLKESRLFPLRPVTAVLKWPLSDDLGDLTRVATCVARTVWPKNPQTHIANAPAELEPDLPGFPLRFYNLEFTTVEGATVDASTKQFTAPAPGYTVLRFLNTGGVPPNPANHPSLFQVVRTVAWNDPAYLRNGLRADIGQPLSRSTHNDPTGKNGFVYFPKAFVDTAGEDRTYDRATRSGPILPVNRDTSAADDDLVVIWYRTNEVTGIAWPAEPVRYLARWPENPPQLILAGGEGSGELSVVEYPNKRLYHQDNPSLPGYNPNEEHAALYGDTLYALRNDLNTVIGVSEPYCLLKYSDPVTGQWAMRVFRVVATNDVYQFHYSGVAGQELSLPRPLSLLSLCGQTNTTISGPGYQDHYGRLYARGAGTLETSTNVVARYWYPLQPEFFYDLDRDGQPEAQTGECIPWLDRRPGGVTDTPVDLVYDIHWPSETPNLQIGETLFNARQGMPAVRFFASAQVVFDQGDPHGTNPLASRVRLFDPLSERTLALGDAFELPPEIGSGNLAGRKVFVDLPYAIRSRLFYDPLNKCLSFGGLLNEDIRYGGPDNPLLLPNVLSPRERDSIKALSANPAFRDAIDRLYDLTRNPNHLDLDGNGLADPALLIGLAHGYETNQVTREVSTTLVHEELGDLPKALTGGLGAGSGYVTIAENDLDSLSGLPVTLHLLRVDNGPFLGDLKVLYPDNVFDEKLTIRHSADFAGQPQQFEFEWYYQPDEPGFDRTNLPVVNAEGQVTDLRGWIRHTAVPAGVNGANDITFGAGGGGAESNLLTLSDNWVICRYRGYTIGDQENVWSDWVGAIGGGEAQLAEGWVKRVVFGLNPFEARSAAFHENETATYASMIQQAGPRYEGPIAFNPSAENLNRVGLIQAYQTVLDRGKALSIDGSPRVNYAPANNALLLAAGRIADFYVLLGNESMADAADPTIGFRTDSAGYGTLAPSIFTFQNQLDSLLEEELALLRGRDTRSATVKAPPAYNRLFWNFTKDQGEVAYTQAYNITDQNNDGFITAEDARILYPQGHGDAWGHYLTAVKSYYDLLRNEFFEWVPRAESMLLGGVPVQVDYLDERKFARAAAAKAKAGAEILDLTYRMHYVDDPAGQYQGYKDTDAARGWGLSEWGHRAGQGAFFDWVTANAILPANDPDPDHTGLTKIDRTTVMEIDEITASGDVIQDQLDKADTGLNPLGLAKNVVPFDIDPNEVSQGKTHFEQIYERALKAMENAGSVFNHANSLSQSLRSLQDSVNDFSRNTQEQERDFKNLLIEVFGYPYAGDIGAGRTYPSGYDGPDLYHYMYVNATELNGETAPISETFTGYFNAMPETYEMPFGLPDLSVEGNPVLRGYGLFFPDDLPASFSNPDLSTDGILEVSYPMTASDFGFVAPTEWGRRRAPGEIQLALSEMLQSEARLKQALINYDNLLKTIDDHVDLLEARYALRSETISIRDTMEGKITTWSLIRAAAAATVKTCTALRGRVNDTYKLLVEAMPKVVGFSNDVTAPGRAALWGSETISRNLLGVGVVIGEAAAEGADYAMRKARNQAALDIETAGYEFEVQQRLKELEQLVRQETLLRTEAFATSEKLSQNVGRYQAAVAKGLRLIDERIAFRKLAAADTQTHRYQDMTFRIFRNDAIQKYRAQFDLAARYVYLAAIAYDYETQLLGDASGSGRDFLTDIVRQRSLGQFENGRPVAGRHGLADPLARLNQNFAVLKGQLGFNNPQTETGRFSLRRELLRLGDSSDEAWREALRQRLVPDLWKIPEFRRYCRPFAPESAGPQPGLVLRFPTTVTFGMNYFGWPLGGGDSAYDPSLFATKVRSAGVWFSDYEGNDLSLTPRVYLVPVGSDILRSPSGRDLDIREWRVVDQKLPVPFPIGFSDLNDSAWIPINDSLSDTFGDIRRFSSFRAYHDSGYFDPVQTISDSRLIGRSVWNTDWMLVIPGGTFLYDPDQGLETLINSVSDIKIFFQTYAYSGN